ncbi:efflux RND transporter periplasmic adaptor subunit [Planctellipticum variicoloris]|uniref:efflux RND transporter periplasmic adaptor subunit n=1 Tax=Planctellipticum variicoloris TaxID=3064265 RepID=UPI0030137FF3|nr:efflux RND transporter periplasmic adaptor subunit [Planctomycetaceae bacterium SH412]
MPLNADAVRFWIKRAVQVVVAVAVVAIAGVWYLSPLAVIEHTVEAGEIVAEVMGTGTLEARVKSTISPKISGRIHEILVDQGDVVQAGQLLFTLDDAELKQQVEIAEAAVAASQASLARLQADLDLSQALLKFARLTFERTQQLLQKKVATVEEGEKATESLSVAEAGVSRATAALLEGQKQVVETEKTLTYHEARLTDTRVVAPFDGLIVKRYRDPGDIGVPGSAILMLVSTKEIWVSAWVDETEMSRVRQGQTARVVFRSEGNLDYEGVVSRLGREADRETREFVVDVRVLTLPENWAVGQRAEVFIEVERKSAVPVLPAKFVVWRDRNAGVYRRNGSAAQWQPVALGLQSAESVEAAEGLKPGDVVLLPIAGKNISLDGRRVETP